MKEKTQFAESFSLKAPIQKNGFMEVGTHLHKTKTAADHFLCPAQHPYLSLSLQKQAAWQIL